MMIARAYACSDRIVDIFDVFWWAFTLYVSLAREWEYDEDDELQLFGEFLFPGEKRIGGNLWFGEFN